MFRALCVHHQEVKIVLYSIWYHHTETSEWSKITKIYKVAVCIYLYIHSHETQQLYIISSDI